MRTAALLCSFLMLVAIGPAQARERLHMVGSSIVSDYSALVGERFARRTPFPAPRIETTGNDGGFKRFCAGVGREHPDILGASRAITDAEFAECRANGVRRLTEIVIGYEAIVLAARKASRPLAPSKADIFAALAREVEVAGKIVENPHHFWPEVKLSLAGGPIKVFGPPAGAELYDIFVSGIMVDGCEQFGHISALPKSERYLTCTLIRADGYYEGLRGNGRRLFEHLKADPNSIAILAYSSAQEMDGGLMLLPVGGVQPTWESIAGGDYGPTQPLYLYAKVQHYGAVPGLLEFIDAYTSEQAWGPEGYLADEGLTPLSDRDRLQQRSNAIGLNPLWR